MKMNEARFGRRGRWVRIARVANALIAPTLQYRIHVLMVAEKPLNLDGAHTRVLELEQKNGQSLVRCARESGAGGNCQTSLVRAKRVCAAHSVRILGRFMPPLTTKARHPCCIHAASTWCIEIPDVSVRVTAEKRTSIASH